MSENLGYFVEDTCRASSYSRPLTACNSIFCFDQLGKTKFWKTKMKQHNHNNDSLTRTFIHLGDQPTNIDPKDIDIIAKYISNWYGLDTTSATSFGSLHLHQFVKYTKHMSSDTCTFSCYD